MLGRKGYTAEEIGHARTALAAQLAALRAHPDPDLAAAVLTALDRRFVHRVRPFSGKDTNPLTEVELLVESLLDHGGVLTTNTVVKYVPGKAVLGIGVGEPVHLDPDGLDRLTAAFLAEVEARSAG